MKRLRKLIARVEECLIALTYTATVHAFVICTIGMYDFIIHFKAH